MKKVNITGFRTQPKEGKTFNYLVFVKEDETITEAFYMSQTGKLLRHVEKKLSWKKIDEHMYAGLGEFNENEGLQAEYAFAKTWGHTSEEVLKNKLLEYADQIYRKNQPDILIASVGDTQSVEEDNAFAAALKKIKFSKN